MSIVDILIWGLVGALVGWHVPQPFWVTAIKSKLFGDSNSKTIER